MLSLFFDVLSRRLFSPKPLNDGRTEKKKKKTGGKERGKKFKNVFADNTVLTVRYGVCFFFFSLVTLFVHVSTVRADENCWKLLVYAKIINKYVHSRHFTMVLTVFSTSARWQNVFINLFIFFAKSQTMIPMLKLNDQIMH